MRHQIGKDFVQREAGQTLQRVGKRKATTEYEEAQEAFRKNYERLKAERLAREAAKSNGK
jgi:hypothetical protein